jgi:hypothetical protein
LITRLAAVAVQTTPDYLGGGGGAEAASLNAEALASGHWDDRGIQQDLRGVLVLIPPQIKCSSLTERMQRNCAYWQELQVGGAAMRLGGWRGRGWSAA